MAYFYTYLISTLPTLSFGARPPFSWEKFIHYCRRFIPEDDIRILEKVSLSAEFVPESAHPTLKKWREFDTALRNELVKARASKKHVDPTKYLRQDKIAEHFIIHIALSASRSTSILEAERILDQERWRMLDEFSFGHYFDLDFLIIYALKLLLLERWERVNLLDKAGVLEEALRLN